MPCSPARKDHSPPGRSAPQSTPRWNSLPGASPAVRLRPGCLPISPHGLRASLHSCAPTDFRAKPWSVSPAKSAPPSMSCCETPTASGCSRPTLAPPANSPSPPGGRMGTWLARAHSAPLGPRRPHLPCRLGTRPSRRRVSLDCRLQDVSPRPRQPAGLPRHPARRLRPPTRSLRPHPRPGAVQIAQPDPPRALLPHPAGPHLVATRPARDPDN